MKRKIILILIIVILVILLVVFIKLYNNLVKSAAYEETINYSNEESNDSIISESRIIEVNKNTFDNEVLKDESIVLVDFYATWCEPCKKMKPIIEELSNEYTSIKFVEIDIDYSPKIAEDYNVMYIPTFIIFKNGEVKDRIVGMVSREELINLFN